LRAPASGKKKNSRGLGCKGKTFLGGKTKAKRRLELRRGQTQVGGRIEEGRRGHPAPNRGQGQRGKTRLFEVGRREPARKWVGAKGKILLKPEKGTWIPWASARKAVPKKRKLQLKKRPGVSAKSEQGGTVLQKTPSAFMCTVRPTGKTRQRGRDPIPTNPGSFPKTSDKPLWGTQESQGSTMRESPNVGRAEKKKTGAGKKPTACGQKPELQKTTW